MGPDQEAIWHNKASVSERQEDGYSCEMSSNQPLRKRLWSKAERAPISI